MGSELDLLKKLRSFLSSESDLGYLKLRKCAFPTRYEAIVPHLNLGEATCAKLAIASALRGKAPMRKRGF